jgi:hypothetical protein
MFSMSTTVIIVSNLSEMLQYDNPSTAFRRCPIDSCKKGEKRIVQHVKRHHNEFDIIEKEVCAINQFNKL